MADLGSAPVRGLLLGCHPGPALAVTAAITAVAAALGAGPVGVLLVFLAVATGQVSIGWANDARDGQRDVLAGRVDKPVVEGLVTERVFWVAALTALAACVPLSVLAGGAIGGAAHIVAVASAWAYNLWLKTTVWSFLPYLVSFGLFPAFLTYGLTPPRPPAGWVVATVSLLGLGAHLANGIPDIESDRVSSSEGLVGRLGARRAATLAVVALLAAASLLVMHLTLPPAAGAVVLAGLASAAILAARVSQGRHLFPAIVLLALLNVLLLVLNVDAVVGA